ncbi:MAG: tetratricopeptide repeat protein [Phycisphaerae bacterium]|nr:tetratricopeptide repeat protein [Phycisphaerae bacterium]
MQRLSIHDSVRSWRLWTLVTVCLYTPILFGQVDPVSRGMESANDLVLTDLPKTDASREAWRDRTSPARATSKDTESKKKLQNTLQKLKSLRFSNLQKPETEVTSPDANQPATEPSSLSKRNQPVIIIRAPGPSEIPAASNDIHDSNSMLTPKTTEALGLLSQSPEKVLDPEALAEILFHSKTYPQAALYYEETLNRLNRKTMAPSEDKAWLLFQIGNCLQQSDPDKTMRMYKQLISEHPHSLWAELARVKGQCITWEIREKPMALVTEIKSHVDSNSKK